MTVPKTLAGIGAVAAAVALLFSTMTDKTSKGGAATPTENAAASSAPTMAAIDPSSLPATPKFLAPSGADDAALARKSIEARRALVKTVRLPNGIEATLAPTRARFSEGALVELVLD